VIHWRKSSHSSEQGECVELAALPAAFGVRDSKHPHSPHLEVGRSALAGLLSSIKDGSYDR
jgi:hypothetical protein